jgi:hypothetical protein
MSRKARRTPPVLPSSSGVSSWESRTNILTIRDPSLLVVPLLVKATKTAAAAEQWQEQRNHELYQANFGTQVPLEAMRILRAADLVSLIQDSIAINIPMAETGWTLPMEFSLRGCCIMDRATPSKGPDGEWLH